jgi:hypothetical protein
VAAMYGGLSRESEARPNGVLQSELRLNEAL